MHNTGWRLDSSTHHYLPTGRARKLTAMQDMRLDVSAIAVSSRSSVYVGRMKKLGSGVGEDGGSTNSNTTDALTGKEYRQASKSSPALGSAYLYLGCYCHEGVT